MSNTLYRDTSNWRCVAFYNNSKKKNKISHWFGSTDFKHVSKTKLFHYSCLLLPTWKRGHCVVKWIILSSSAAKRSFCFVSQGLTNKVGCYIFTFCGSRISPAIYRNIFTNHIFIYFMSRNAIFRNWISLKKYSFFIHFDLAQCWPCLRYNLAHVLITLTHVFLFWIGFLLSPLARDTLEKEIKLLAASE